MKSGRPCYWQPLPRPLCRRVQVGRGEPPLRHERPPGDLYPAGAQNHHLLTASNSLGSCPPHPLCPAGGNIALHAAVRGEREECKVGVVGGVNKKNRPINERLSVLKYGL